MFLDWFDPKGKHMCAGRATAAVEEHIDHSKGAVDVVVYICPRLRFTYHLAPLILLRAYPMGAVFPTFTLYMNDTAQEGGSIVVLGPSRFALIGEPEFEGNLAFLFPKLIDLGHLRLNYLDLQMMISPLITKYAPACLENP